jgi:hypothetical protein
MPQYRDSKVLRGDVRMAELIGPQDNAYEALDDSDPASLLISS